MLSVKEKEPPPRQPSGIVLASSAGGPGFNPSQGQRNTKDVIKMVPVKCPCLALYIQKGTGSFSKIKIGK